MFYTCLVTKDTSFLGYLRKKLSTVAMKSFVQIWSLCSSSCVLYSGICAASWDEEIWMFWRNVTAFVFKGQFSLGRKLLFLSDPWRWRLYVPGEHQDLFTVSHCIMFHKNGFLVKTVNMVHLFVVCRACWTLTLYVDGQNRQWLQWCTRSLETTRRNFTGDTQKY
jgi:hypothetical protein